MRIAVALALLAALAAAPSAAQPPASAPQPTPGPQPPGGTPPTPAPRALALPSTSFQLVLLVAETTGPSALAGLSPRAERALADLREFLPYRSYRLIDQVWLRTDRRAETTATGPGGEPLEVVLMVEPGGWPWPPGAGEREAAPRTVRVSELSLLARAPGSPARQLLKTSLDLELGETIVVGTSKLDGPNKALVVLLSALP